MKREIKFRAWDGKRLLYEKEVVITKTGVVTVGGYVNDCLMQYTGLKDMRGREIWEGDILKHDLWGVDQVVWDDLCACFRCKKEGESGHDITLAHHQLKRTKVIGNIYEDERLLQ